MIIYMNIKTNKIMRTINLGYTNGWDNETTQLYKELYKNKVDGSTVSKNIGNCLNEYYFKTIQNDEVIEVTYKVDSGN